MDSVSQIVLGAATAEAVLGKKVGNKAMLWGAIAGTIPDLDVLSEYFLNPFQALVFHRGFTHSIVFALIMAPILGYLVSKLYAKKGEADWKGWSLLFLVSIGTHPLLDCFTTWGTQLLWPFSEARIAWNTIFVLDPLYTIPFLICVVGAMAFKRTDPRRRKVNYAGIIISSAYLAFTVVNKFVINNVFETALKQQGIEYVQYSTNPTPLNNILWSTIAETEDHYYYGLYSHMDEDKYIELVELPKNHELLADLEGDKKIERLKFISKGYYNVSTDSTGTLLFNDLRFGLMNAGQDEKPQYVIKYKIKEQPDGTLSLEPIMPERKASRMTEMLAKVINRAKGNK